MFCVVVSGNNQIRNLFIQEDMIQATELRLGNWVFSKETQQPQQITGLTDENPFINAITFDYTMYDEIEPIPLTEDLLLKSGFEIRKDGKLWHEELSLYEVDFFLNSKSDRIKHLHQLQNLFYSLAGQELEVSWS